MAPLPHSCSFTKLLLLLFLVFVLFTTCSAFSRRILESEPIKKKTALPSTSNNHTKLFKNQTKQIKISTLTSLSKNQTKTIKISSPTAFGSIKNQTKLSKSKLSDSIPFQSKNKTKLVKPSSSSSPTITKSEKFTFKSQLKKLNSTTPKSSNSTNKTSDLTKTSSNASTPKNRTAKATKPQLEKDSSEFKSSKKQPNEKKPKKQQTYSWLEDDEDDLISGFRDLPSKFQETLLPDLEKISKTSKVYINKANKELTNNFIKPYVGNKYAPTIASVTSFAFILIPLILVSLIFNKIKAYFSLQRLIIFIQIYLSIYFTILCLSSLITGLEPLKFFYATAKSTYICLQVLQTLAYVLYLLMLLMYLVLVFSTETGSTTKLIGLGQTFVGFAVGLHYYMTVFHRAVLHQPPKTSWRVHAVYATFFLFICLSSSADRRKKAYLVQGGEVEKKS